MFWHLTTQRETTRTNGENHTAGEHQIERKHDPRKPLMHL